MNKEKYDLVLLDYRLPDTDGLKIMGGIEKKGLNVPVLFLTGKGSEKIAVEALKKGACDYITKDEINKERLPGLISYYLELSDLYNAEEIVKHFKVTKKRDSLSIMASILSYAQQEWNRGNKIYSKNR